MIKRLTGLLLYGVTGAEVGERREDGDVRQKRAKVPSGTVTGGAHQGRRERQAPHRGLQLVHGGGDALGAVRDQRLDSDFELFPAVLVVLGLAGGEELLPPGSWWACVKDTVVHFDFAAELFPPEN